MSEASDHNLRHEDMQYFNLPKWEDPDLNDLGLTIVHPFYNEKMRFDLQYKRWQKWTYRCLQKVKVVIGDDCSDPGVHTYVEKPPLIDLKIYRAKEDLKFNTPGCLNMAIKEATTEWILVMDSDCMLEPKRLDWLMDYKPSQDFCMRFHRDRVTNNPKYDKHRILGCSILFSKTQWEKVGGFDEDFTGHWSGGYGYFDNDFNRKLAKIGTRKAVPVGLHVTEYLDDVLDRPNIQVIEGVRMDSEHNINKKLSYQKHKDRSLESPFDRICRFEYEMTYSMNAMERLV